MGAVLSLQHRAARAPCDADGDEIVQEPRIKGITPSQTVGPFFAYGLTSNGKYDWNDAFTNNLVTADSSGERIRIEGRVFDGDGEPVPDCMLEIWQADAQGRFSDPKDKRALPNSAFRGFGRCGTDPALALVPTGLRSTLIAKRQPGNGNAVYRFDIRLQGANETVFFDV